MRPKGDVDNTITGRTAVFNLLQANGQQPDIPAEGEGTGRRLLLFSIRGQHFINSDFPGVGCKLLITGINTGTEDLSISGVYSIRVIAGTGRR